MWAGRYNERFASIAKVRYQVLYILAFLLCLVPPALAFLFIHAYGVNVAVVDDFFFVDGFAQYFAGNLSLDYFMRLHNDHCLFFGKILMLALGLCTHFNIIAEMFLSWGFLLLTFLALTSLAVKTLGWKPSTIFTMFPVSLTLFSLRPWDVFLNGSVFLNSMTIFFVTLSVVLLYLSQTKHRSSMPLLVISTSESISSQSETVENASSGSLPVKHASELDAKFITALFTAFIGTFSGSASGLITWIIGWLQLVPKSIAAALKSPRFIIWTAASAIFGTIYMVLRAQAHSAHGAAAGGGSIANHLAMVPPYLATLLGFPMCTDIGSMPTCGGVVLIIYAIVAFGFAADRPFSKNTDAIRAGLSIFLFGMFAVGLITLGRSERGAIEATATRYVQFSEIMAIGAYLMVCFSDFQRKAVRIRLLVLLLGMMGATSYVGYSVANTYGTFWRNLQFKNAYLLRNYKMQTDKDLTVLQSNAAFVRGQAAKMESLKLNVFARDRVELDDVPQTAEAWSYCVDRIGAQPSPKTPISIAARQNDLESISISGWAFDQNSKAPAKRIALLVARKDGLAAVSEKPVVMPACYGLCYPGVDKSFKSAKLIDSGFFASFSPRILKPGKYQIRIAVEASDARSIAVTKPLIELSVTE